MISKDREYISLYRPSKMEREVREKKKMLEEGYIGVSKHLNVDLTHLMRRVEGKAVIEPTGKPGVKRIVISPQKKKEKNFASPLKKSSLSNTLRSSAENMRLSTKVSGMTETNSEHLPTLRDSEGAPGFNEIMEENQETEENGMLFKGLPPIPIMETNGEMDDLAEELEGTQFIDTNRISTERVTMYQQLASQIDRSSNRRKRTLETLVQKSLNKAMNIQAECEQLGVSGRVLDQYIIEINNPLEKLLNFRIIQRKE